ncbi:hypothetical protein BLNAU_20414 [Blattamonas nauphoetae]|uniref:Uncharacterized protein n=1 Tax=Blattamonas nauphoetae TaxID=2049346 RepID=A0ABQ9WZC4_9EUKA|nr:hypothetical protein BLNAU_20414 [Blattamonas nauphoetae]
MFPFRFVLRLSSSSPLNPFFPPPGHPIQHLPTFLLLLQISFPSLPTFLSGSLDNLFSLRHLSTNQYSLKRARADSDVEAIGCGEIHSMKVKLKSEEEVSDGFRLLLKGERTRVVRKPSKVAAQATGMLQFVGMVRTCINCKTRMARDEQGAVCAKCKPKEPELFLDAQCSASGVEEEDSDVNAQSERCSMWMHQPFLCSS